MVQELAALLQGAKEGPEEGPVSGAGAAPALRAGSSTLMCLSSPAERTLLMLDQILNGEQVGGAVVGGGSPALAGHGRVYVLSVRARSSTQCLGQILEQVGHSITLS